MSPSGHDDALPVVLFAAAFYAGFTLLALALHGWNPLWFVWIGERYASGDPHGLTGYDGQFIYFLARDGWAGIVHLDNPPYRLQRILYPLLTRTLSGGDATAIPWVMIAINAVSILVATFLLTRWLVAQGLARWWGLVYPLFVGTFFAYSRDLTEPLACALALAGVLAWLGERWAGGVALLALACLARETMALFVLGLGLAALWRRQWARAAAVASACLPMLAWQVYIAAAVGAIPLTRSAPFSFVPAAAFFSDLSLEPGRVSALLFIDLPLLALAPVVVGGLVRNPSQPAVWLLAVQWAFLLISPPVMHQHVFETSRISTSLLLALLLTFPRRAPAVRAAVASWSILPTAVWLAPVLWWAPWTAKF